MATVSPTQQRLAALLKQLRARSGMSAAALGRILGWTQTRVSRAENAGRRVSLAEAIAWAEATNAPDDLKAEVTELAEASARAVRSWWSVHAGGMARRQQEIAELEAGSTAILNTQHVIPGLLQTADYARHALELANVSGQTDIPAAMARRLHRQEILYDPARQFDYVLPESALHVRLADDAALMRAQADRLLSLDTLPNVSIAVLPYSVPYPVWPGSFALYEIPDEPLVVIEYLTGEATIGDEGEVGTYREAFARLRAAAVTGEDAHRIIREATTG